MRGKDQAFDLLELAIKEARNEGLEAEANWVSYHESTMRSAWGEVHQTPAANAGVLAVEVRQNSKAVSIALAQCNRKSVRDAILKAKEILPMVPENPYLPDLVPQPADLPEERLSLQEIPEFDKDLTVKEYTFSQIRKASCGSLKGSARFFTAACEVGVANTNGLLRYHTASYSFLALVVTGPKGLSSYADRVAPRPELVDVDGAIEEALGRASLAQKLPFYDPFSNGVKTKNYDVVMSHYASGEWIYWLSMHTFNGLQVSEKQSYASNKSIGDIITGGNITITDNWLHPRVVPLPFDFEGRTPDILPILERGRLCGIPYDGMTAKKMGVASTGHAGGDDPVPSCLIFQGGSETFEELIRKSVKPTIVATYLNYPAMPDPREAVFTATTRHGTFLVEDGEYRAVCPPLRLRMKSFDALSRISGMTEEMIILGEENYEMFYPVSLIVPAMRIDNIEFVGSNPQI